MAQAAISQFPSRDRRLNVRCLTTGAYYRDMFSKLDSETNNSQFGSHCARTFARLSLVNKIIRHDINHYWRCPWCNRYRHRMWTRRYEFNSFNSRLIVFSHSTNTLGKGMNPIILPPAMGK